METTRGRIAATAGVALLSFAAAGSVPAGADIVSPPGACVGSATWSDGTTETSTDHRPSDVIVVPRADTVSWTGSQGAAGADGPRRDISGKVTLDLPVGTVTIDDWSGSSVRYANQGQHDYDLPSILAGVKMKLAGVHAENGTTTCQGSVYVEVAGGGPLKPLALGGLVLSGVALAFAGKPVSRGSKPLATDGDAG